MTNEELLQPRFKLIADYPGNEDYLVGSTLDRDWCSYVNDEDESEGVVWRISDFPHLFKELKWWEERNVNDLPLHLNTTYNGTTSKIFSYDLQEDTVYIESTKSVYKMSLTDYLSARVPVTEAEYLAGLNKQP